MFGLKALARLRHAPLELYASLQREQGDRARLRLGPYRLHVLFHPREIEDVLTTQSNAFLRLERVMRVLAQWNGQSVLILEGDAWRARRRRILPAFARRRMQRAAECSVFHARALAKAWTARAAADGNVMLDLDREMAQLSLRIGLDVMFGTQARAEGEIAEAVTTLSEVAYSESSGLWRAPMWAPFGLGRRKARATKTLDQFVRDLIAERMASGEDRGDLLSLLLADDPRDARDDAVTLLIAGHETTGATLCWLGFLLGGAPEALAQSLNEVDHVLQGRAAQLDDYEALPFLRAAIAESLRLFPPAYGLFPRRATRGVKVGEVEIAAGDIVQIAPYVTHRDPRWFDEPAAFRPERFLNPPTWPAYAYLPFGAGPRMCIGQQFALIEMTLAMATLLQSLVPAPVLGDVTPEAKFSLRPQGGLPQIWRVRR